MEVCLVIAGDFESELRERDESSSYKSHYRSQAPYDWNLTDFFEWSVPDTYHDSLQFFKNTENYIKNEGQK